MRMRVVNAGLDMVFAVLFVVAVPIVIGFVCGEKIQQEMGGANARN